MGACLLECQRYGHELGVRTSEGNAKSGGYIIGGVSAVGIRAAKDLQKRMSEAQYRSARLPQRTIVDPLRHGGDISEARLINVKNA
ncbi:hypothetical protein PHLCEN_2v12634 [Hermanssonia centrifuga]|uniref:Uncharacterized protein n=1 Tax=Hermanssonia centrifuga TaxID=98765 RepID=A0A2R6NGI3_9APHY|nr:hypothetical protein PHLCEN_2v12634 [Hermanssonia centrifuga]